MERANSAATLDKAENRALAAKARLAALRALGNHFLVAEIGFVNFNRHAVAADRTKVAFPHGFTNTMRQEPSRLQGDFQNAIKLVGTDTLLGRAHQVDCLKPLGQGDMGILKDRAYADSELLTAFAALLQTVTLNTIRALLRRLGEHAFKLVDAAHAAAMRANRTFRPQNAFHMSKGCGFIVKIRAGQNGHCDTQKLSCWIIYPTPCWVCQV
jgi:hypothetical protein